MVGVEPSPVKGVAATVKEKTHNMLETEYRVLTPLLPHAQFNPLSCTAEKLVKQIQFIFVVEAVLS